MKPKTKKLKIEPKIGYTLSEATEILEKQYNFSPGVLCSLTGDTYFDYDDEEAGNDYYLLCSLFCSGNGQIYRNELYVPAIFLGISDNSPETREGSTAPCFFAKFLIVDQIFWTVSFSRTQLGFATFAKIWKPLISKQDIQSLQDLIDMV